VSETFDFRDLIVPYTFLALYLRWEKNNVADVTSPFLRAFLFNHFNTALPDDLLERFLAPPAGNGDEVNIFVMSSVGFLRSITG